MATILTGKLVTFQPANSSNPASYNSCEQHREI